MKLRNELKEYWCINSSGKILSCLKGASEEAEKAVEKLKAWKRLKDKGFRFRFWQNDGTIFFEMPRDEQEWSSHTRDDINLLFGGEE